MTPAIELVKKKKIKHTLYHYPHDSNHSSYGQEAAESLGQNKQQVFKTLLFCINDKDKNLAVAIIPVANKLSLKRAAKAMNAKKAAMANPEIAQKITGYLVGGISPLGQKKALPTFIDQSAKNFESIFVSAGRRGLEIELNVYDLCKLTRARLYQLCEE